MLKHNYIIIIISYSLEHIEAGKNAHCSLLDANAMLRIRINGDVRVLAKVVISLAGIRIICVAEIVIVTIIIRVNAAATRYVVACLASQKRMIVRKIWRAVNGKQKWRAARTSNAIANRLFLIGRKLLMIGWRILRVRLKILQIPMIGWR